MALLRNGYARQQDLADDLRLTRTTVSNFLNGKPIDYLNFLEICGKLGLDYQKVAGLTETITEVLASEQDSSIDIDSLVQSCREKVKPYIKERCGTMRVLDMTQSIGLDDIYTNVNILETITGRRRLKIEDLQAELLQNSDTEELDRFGLYETQKRVPELDAVQEHSKLMILGDVREKRVAGLKAVNKYSKLMILGKPGAGKTTFLKHLALQCIEGRFQPNRIPLFITLKDFAEAPNQPSLLEYFIQLFIRYGIAPNTKVKTGFLAYLFNRGTSETNQLVDLTAVEQLLKQGKLFLLLDGLDEVREAESKRILQEIQNFTNLFPQNQFVITCRIAAREYTFMQFTEVEIADFDSQQIASFAKKWFQAKDDIVKAKRFIKKLEEEKPIRELATNPLLLTLLYLVFEESGSFPQNRAELYKEGLDVLLKKWDVMRNIERDQVYKKLSLKRKEDLLSQIALDTFEQGNYFFKQKVVERYITQYIQNLPDASTDSKALQLDSEAVLKSIEAQHGLFVERARGIYSFSHLTFHEYFTARKLVSSINPNTLQDLATHITEKRWRDVFLLTVGILNSADSLLQLMKQQIDALLKTDKKLQQFLAGLEEKSHFVETPYKPAAIRAFHFDLALDFDLTLVRALVFDFDLTQDRNLALDLDLARALTRTRNLDHALNRDLSLELKRSLQQLKAQLPNPEANLEAYKQWWQKNGQAWTEQLRAITIAHRNIGHDWQFSKEQKELLKQYYDANKLLVDCLNSDCYMSREVRQEIEDTLLLPVKR